MCLSGWSKKVLDCQSWKNNGSGFFLQRVYCKRVSGKFVTECISVLCLFLFLGLPLCRAIFFSTALCLYLEHMCVCLSSC